MIAPTGKAAIHQRALPRPKAMRGVLLAVALATAVAAPQQPQDPASRADPFLTGKPLTLEQIIEAAPVIYEGRLRQAIEGRGVAFTATREALEKLRKNAVSEALLRVISRLAPAVETDAKPKAPPQAGPLIIECSPAECEVLINGVSHGSTQGGSKRITGLPAGRAFLDFKKDGYEGQQAAVTLEPGSTAQRRVSLFPTVGTREKFGAELFSRLVESLGGESALQAVRSLSATGTAIVSDPDGPRTTWALVARLLLPNLGFWDVRSGSVNWWVSWKGRQSRGGGSRKLKGSPLIASFETTLRDWLALQPATVVENIRARNLRLLANAAVATGPEGIDLRAEGSDGTYILTVGQDMMLARAVYETNSTPAARIEAIFSDYRPAGPTRYPMYWKVAGSSSQSIEIRINGIEANARLRERDFRK